MCQKDRSSEKVQQQRTIIFNITKYMVYRCQLIVRDTDFFPEDLIYLISGVNCHKVARNIRTKLRL